MMKFSAYEIEMIWQKGIVIDGVNPDEYRMDICGAIMDKLRFVSPHHKTSYGNFDWTIALIKPISMGGNYELSNLRPLLFINAISKGDSYPIWYAIKTATFDEEHPEKFAFVNRNTNYEIDELKIG